MTRAAITGDTGISERLAGVRARISAAAERSGRDPRAVRIVAVTKTVAPERIAEAAAAGITDIAENRVQEAEHKHALVPPGLHWHLVGHLQTNKAALAARLFDTVHSLDSARAGAALSRHRDPSRGPLRGLLEVDYTGIPQRTGVSPQAVEELLRGLRGHPGLDLVGLMTIAPFGDPAAARDCFRKLRQLRDRLQERIGAPLPELSMGMTDDFEPAVEEGATMVRLGRVIFGERPPQP
ncbi:MAG TPA: YggS family pyridoxal phosphate-dependent enzyme [Candidatus Binatia bacterium]|nr:YggS family pyridoxal phosphate-dependent enzyme [Candidatus Binatia bacterium]